MQGWKSIPNTQITLSTGLAGFVKSVKTPEHVTEHFIYSIACVFDSERTQAPALISVQACVYCIGSVSVWL